MDISLARAVKDEKEPSRALPSYLYFDPAETIERIDRKERIELEPRVSEVKPALLGPNTRRLIKRQRIRELMKTTKRAEV